VPDSSYPAVAAAFVVELIFDLTIAVPILRFAFTQGVVPEAAGLLQAAGLRPRVLRLAPALHAVPADRARDRGARGFALLSARVRAFWARVRQGLTILRDRRRYFREVWLVQFAAGCFRFTRSGSCSRRSTSAARSATCCSCSASTRSRRCVPFTPGGAGVQQALLVKVFAARAARPSPPTRSASRSRSRR
jgi:hypothetical protein